jgi:hypothetical protein
MLKEFQNSDTKYDFNIDDNFGWKWVLADEYK